MRTKTQNGSLTRWICAGWLALALTAGPPVKAQVYQYSTIAGSAGYGGADGTNGAAEFSRPYKLVVDSHTNIFVADTGGAVIRKITPAGTNWVTTTIAGQSAVSSLVDGTNNQAEFIGPYAITLDISSNLYVTDGNSIRRISPVGTNWVVTQIAGGVGGMGGNSDGTNLNATFAGPAALAVDSATNLYVADSGNHLIRRISPVGTNWVTTTLAGLVGTSGTNDGTNFMARFNYPSGIGVDGHTNIYVADTSNNSIRKIALLGTNWVVTTIAGVSGSANGNVDGNGGSAEFGGPSDIKIDAHTNIYVPDQGTCVIRRVSPSGATWAVTTLAGSAYNYGNVDGTNANARFYSPSGVAVDGQTNIYVSDRSNNNIRRVSPVAANWVVTTVAGRAGGSGNVNGTNQVARFNYPYGVDVDNADNIYVVDTLNDAIRKITPVGSNWVTTTIAGGSSGYNDGTNDYAQFTEPSGIAADPHGNFYIADSQAETIRKMTPAGTNWVVTTIAGTAGVSGTNDGTNFTARFSMPWGIAADSRSNVFVVDQYNYTIRKVSPNGTNWVVTTIAGAPGSSGTADGTNNVARFGQPYGITRGPGGQLYVADGGDYAIREIVPEGTNWVVTTIAGGSFGEVDGTNRNAEFYVPAGISQDANGNLYVSETGNLIRKLTLQGTNWVVTTIGGQTALDYYPFYADGTNSKARFYDPYGMAADPRGNLFIADTANDVIRLGQSLTLQLQIYPVTPATNHQAALYWQAWSTNVLQTTSVITNTVWTNLTGAVWQGASFVSTNGTTNRAAFFRLH